MLTVLRKIAFEFVVVVPVNYDKNACDGLSTCKKAVIRFQTRLRVMIQNSFYLILMEH